MRKVISALMVLLLLTNSIFLIGSKLKEKQKINVEGNQFISSLEINLKDNKTYIVVGIKDPAREYMIKKYNLPDQLPYFSVSFSGVSIIIGGSYEL